MLTKSLTRAGSFLCLLNRAPPFMAFIGGLHWVVLALLPLQTSALSYYTSKSLGHVSLGYHSLLVRPLKSAVGWMSHLIITSRK